MPVPEDAIFGKFVQ